MAKNLPKTPRQKPAKNPMRTKICLDYAKIFNDSLTKNLLKILNNTKNFLISPNKTKTFIMSNKKTYCTIAELKQAIKEFNDNDIVVVEIHEGHRNEDLYDFYVDSIQGVSLTTGEIVSEVRICI
jgi:hypothetical protein